MTDEHAKDYRALLRAYNQKDDILFDLTLSAMLARREELETALLLTVSWLKKFQDHFDELGDGDFGTFAYGHRQMIEGVLGKGKLP